MKEMLEKGTRIVLFYFSLQLSLEVGNETISAGSLITIIEFSKTFIELYENITILIKGPPDSITASILRIRDIFDTKPTIKQGGYLEMY